MSVCKHCGWIGGYHSAFCERPAPTPAPTHYVEYFGRLQVHQPVKESPVSENTECACTECQEIDAFTISVLLNQDAKPRKTL